MSIPFPGFPSAEEERAERIVLFKVDSDYEILGPVGHGSFGDVASALHVPSGKKVAIKKISPFHSKSLCVRTLREIKLMRHFDHENIVEILRVLTPDDFNDMTAVYLVQELMETDLSQVIRTQPLSEDHRQYLMHQLLRGANAIHSANVVHRDIKPGNILVNSDCRLKICDFGFARPLPLPASDDGDSAQMTQYVCTRWYRAPDVIVEFGGYNKAIDIWSVGCIFSEMISGKPLFPGKNCSEQLSLIIDVLGTPCEQDLDAIQTDRGRCYIESLPRKAKIPFYTIHQDSSMVALDLLEKLLAFNPAKRVTASEALVHPYLGTYRDGRKAEKAVPVVSREFLDFEKRAGEMTKEQVKILIYEEIMG